MSKIYIIAGEASGDFIGANLINSIRTLRNEVQFSGVGGAQMRVAGIDSLFPISQISLMGFFEILPHLFTIKKLITDTMNNVIEYDPDVLITIDSPGFTYRVASRVRKLKPNLKIIHIVAPSVWAYKPGRALKYAKVYDHLLALLPFEPPYFSKVGLDCTYIGHPISEQIFYHDKKQLRGEFKISQSTKIIAVTPGSRNGEICRHMPIFAQSLNMIAKDIPNVQAIFVVNSIEQESLIRKFLDNAEFSFSFSTDKLKIFALADVALAKSGTNTLEIAASGTPLLVAYRLNPITFWMLQLMIKVKYASLINIIADKEVLPEFIQSNCIPEKIYHCLKELLLDHNMASDQVQTSKKILETLGFGELQKKPSMISAEIIVSKILM